VRRIVHARDKADDLAVFLRDEEPLPPPLVNVEVQGRGVVLAKRVPNDR